MKKIWAFLCVVGFTGFWVYGLAIVAALLGHKLFQPYELAFCIAGVSLGLYARVKLLRHTPSMHGHRAPARGRLEKEYLESVRS